MSNNRMRPWLLGCGIVLLAGCILSAVGAFLARNQINNFIDIMSLTGADAQYANGLTTADELLAYLSAEPDAYSLVSYSVDDAGQPTGDVIRHNADRPMPLASTFKIAVLAVVAQAVANGELDLSTPVSLAEWEQTYLPGTDGGAHPAALEALGIATDAHGFAVDDSQSVTLDDVAHAMIRYSDNAATDLLLITLGRDRVDALLAETGLTTQTPLIPLAGLMLSWQNHEQPALDDAHTAEIVAREPAAQADLAWQLAEKMASDAEWRSAEIDFQINDKQSNIANEVKVANATSPAASAEEYARMMAEIATGQFISAEVSDLMHAKLSWPMRDFPENGDAFETMGTKGGTLGGVLTEASYFVPHGEQPRVVVLFQGNMPFAAWLGQLQSFSQQAFMRDLVLNPAFAAEVQETLE